VAVAVAGALAAVAAARAEAGFEQRRAGALEVVLAGDPGAPVLVLLHGLGATWRVWRAAMPRLAREHRVIAIDLPGFGASPPMRGGAWDIDRVGDAIAGALDALGVGQHSLAGHSMGGGCSIAYSERRPDRVLRLALVSPAGLIATGGVRPSWRYPILHSASRVLAALVGPRVAGSERLRRRLLSGLVYDPLALSDEEVRDLVEGSRLGLSTPAAGTAIVYAGLASRLPSLRMPTLVVWGDDDRVVSPRNGPRLVDLVPDGRLVTIERCGHMPMMEYPSEVAAAILTHNR